MQVLISLNHYNNYHNFYNGLDIYKKRYVFFSPIDFCLQSYAIIFMIYHHLWFYDLIFFYIFTKSLPLRS